MRSVDDGLTGFRLFGEYHGRISSTWRTRIVADYVDEFVLFDDAQYTRRDWRNRNVIKTESGPAWLTIPVQVKGRYFEPVKAIEISDPSWTTTHWRTLRANYARAPFFRQHADAIEQVYRDCAGETRLSADDLIMPVFVAPEPLVNEQLPALGRHTVDGLLREADELVGLGVPALLLFGVPEQKDDEASGAWAEDGVVQEALRALSRAEIAFLMSGTPEHEQGLIAVSRADWRAMASSSASARTCRHCRRDSSSTARSQSTSTSGDYRARTTSTRSWTRSRARTCSCTIRSPPQQCAGTRAICRRVRWNDGSRARRA